MQVLTEQILGARETRTSNKLQGSACVASPTMLSGKGSPFTLRQNWIQIPARLLPSAAKLGKPPNLCELRFFHMESVEPNSYPSGLP